MRKIDRRDAIKTAAIGSACAAIAAPAIAMMPPRERIEYHLEGVRDALRELHPDMAEIGEHILVDEREPNGWRGSIIFLITRWEV